MDEFCRSLLLVAPLLFFLSQAGQGNGAAEGPAPAPALGPEEGAEPYHFVLVHGIGHGAWCWFKVKTALEEAGHTASAIDLASAAINRDTTPDNITSVAQYTKPLTDLLAQLALDPGHKVILVGHSLGGGTVAYASELFTDIIDKAVYIAAGSPTYGDTYFNSFAPETFSRLLTSNDLLPYYGNGPNQLFTSVAINPASASSFFYNETPQQELNLALSLITRSPAGMGNEVLPLTPSRFGTVPRYYVKTLADRGVPPADQDYIIQRNPPLCVFDVPRADHAVFLSRPRKLATVLFQIASTGCESASAYRTRQTSTFLSKADGN